MDVETFVTQFPVGHCRQDREDDEGGLEGTPVDTGRVEGLNRKVPEFQA